MSHATLYRHACNKLYTSLPFRGSPRRSLSSFRNSRSPKPEGRIPKETRNPKSKVRTSSASARPSKHRPVSVFSLRVDLVTDKSLSQTKARLILPTVRYAALGWIT